MLLLTSPLLLLFLLPAVLGQQTQPATTDASLNSVKSQTGTSFGTLTSSVVSLSEPTTDTTDRVGASSLASLSGASSATVSTDTSSERVGQSTPSGSSTSSASASASSAAAAPLPGPLDIGAWVGTAGAALVGAVVAAVFL